MKTLAIIFGTCILVCASLFLLPVLAVVAAVALLLSGIFACAELIFVIAAAIAVVIALVAMMHVFIPLLVPVLVVCGIVYIFKQVGKKTT